ncbi:MAG: hypothetical protein QW718_03865 [Nitrososphaerota archaeon]
MQTVQVRVSKWIAGTSLLASTAILMSLLRLRFPYPLLPFLSFDLAEIPAVLALLAFDFKSGFTVAVIHWITLNFGRPFHAIIGPLMKLIAVISMLIGFKIIFSKPNLTLNKRILGYMIISGSLIRIGLMSLATFLLYYVIFPEIYLPTSTQVLKNILVIELESTLLVGVVTVVFTALFNLLHVPLSLLPATSIYTLYKKIKR